MFRSLRTWWVCWLPAMLLATQGARAEDRADERVVMLERKLVCCGALVPLQRDLHRLADLAHTAASDFEAASRLLTLKARIDGGVAQLGACAPPGDRALPSFQEDWKALEQAIPDPEDFDAVFDHRDAIGTVAAELPGFSTDLHLATQALLAGDGRAADVEAIGRLQLAAEGMLRHLEGVGRPGSHGVAAGDRLIRLSGGVTSLLDTLIEGDGSSAPRLADAVVLDALGKARERWRAVLPALEVTMGQVQLLEVRNALQGLRLHLDGLLHGKLPELAGSQGFCGR